jgi:hypothetical protein
VFLNVDTKAKLYVVHKKKKKTKRRTRKFSFKSHRNVFIIILLVSTNTKRKKEKIGPNSCRNKIGTYLVDDKVDVEINFVKCNLWFSN